MNKQKPARSEEPRYKKSLLGVTMERLHKLRRHHREQAMMDVLRRQGITYASVPDNGYLLVDETRVASNGTETIKYRLFKLVDEQTITLSADTQVEVVEGIKDKNLDERLYDGPEKPNTQSSI